MEREEWVKEAMRLAECWVRAEIERTNARRPPSDYEPEARALYKHLCAHNAPAVGPSGADWVSIGTVRIHKTGGNAGIAWSVESNGTMPRDGETIYVKGNVAPGC